MRNTGNLSFNTFASLLSLYKCLTKSFQKIFILQKKKTSFSCSKKNFFKNVFFKTIYHFFFFFISTLNIRIRIKRRRIFLDTPTIPSTHDSLLRQFFLFAYDRLMTCVSLLNINSKNIYLYIRIHYIYHRLFHQISNE